LFSIFNEILLSNGLNLFLSNYSVVSTSTTTGFIEIVPNSFTIESILKNHKSIHKFLCGEDSEPDTNIMNNYIRSCAGYSIITYILAIGDRHLDNILITKLGNFFHIDFGFIIGQDPKPYPPKMKLSTEIIDGMVCFINNNKGGEKSQGFVEFNNLCCKCFSILRKYSNFIILLLNMMTKSELPHLRGKHVDNLKKVVQKNLKLELNEEESSKYIQDLILSSKNQIFPIVIDKFHTLAQNLKS
jgi:phosphatidylinositol 3-kinase